MKRVAYLIVVLATLECSDSRATAPIDHPVDRPVAHAGGPYVSADGIVAFNGAASTDSSGSLLTYSWTFGDGGKATGATATHTYAAVGAFKASLVVTNQSGTSSTPDTATVTAQGAGGAVFFSGAGDIASCGNDNDELTARILDTLPGFIFTGGDNAFESGSATDYANCYDPTWGRFKARTYPVIGNHEYMLGNADASFDYFGTRLGPRGKGYYSVDLGSWHVIVLNDNPTYVPFVAGSEQETWLKADLAANTKPCTIALWHIPLFQSSDTAGYLTNSTRKVLWDDLYAANAELVVNGHQHQYERMAPMNPAGGLDPARGIREFNVGTGGESVQLPTVAIHPNSEVRAAAFGVLKLTLKPASYDWQFIPIAGQTFTDSGSGQCH